MSDANPGPGIKLMALCATYQERAAKAEAAGDHAAAREYRTVAAHADLIAALKEAPRPSVSGDEGWPVRYMDWFFTTRIAALQQAGDG